MNYYIHTTHTNYNVKNIKYIHQLVDVTLIVQSVADLEVQHLKCSVTDRLQCCDNDLHPQCLNGVLAKLQQMHTHIVISATHNVQAHYLDSMVGPA